ncbi:hypothetical protein BDZ88DRAFT_442182 [Geranomyces variabilis]|nr:hypothetical protein BDZ88DRAFT_442182 [Geranomyces variabilis]
MWSRSPGPSTGATFLLGSGGKSLSMTEIPREANNAALSNLHPLDPHVGAFFRTERPIGGRCPSNALNRATVAFHTWRGTSLQLLVSPIYHEGIGGTAVVGHGRAIGEHQTVSDVDLVFVPAAMAYAGPAKFSDQPALEFALRG